MVCIFHKRDLDGWTSAAIVKKKYPCVKLLGWDYGDPIPDMSFKEVVLVDLSFPSEVMIENKNRLIWIDHHASAIKESIDNQYQDMEGLRDSALAACELTWNYLFPGKVMPEAVRLLGMYDSFRHKQVWKSVIDYEGIYEVSNHGNIRSIDRVITENNTGTKRPVNGVILSPAISKRGYRVVVLCKDGTEKMRNIHQIVSEAFIPNPENKPIVNHKDLNRLNNYVSNLEWSTFLENNIHAINIGAKGRFVHQLNEDGCIIDKFDYIIQAKVKTGIQAVNIGKVCRGERKMAGGYRWEYGDIKKRAPQFIPMDEEYVVLCFQYGARAIASDPESAKVFLECNLGQLDQIANAGASILGYLRTEAKQIYAKRGHCTFNGFKFGIVNVERFNPINFGIDYHKDGMDGFACFWFNKGKWTFSLYNDNGLVDCSEICKTFGGGGHTGAAGFQVLDIQNIVNNIWENESK